MDALCVRLIWKLNFKKRPESQYFTELQEFGHNCTNIKMKNGSQREYDVQREDNISKVVYKYNMSL